MIYNLLQIQAVNSTSNYLPIGIQLIFALGLLSLMIYGTSVLGPKRKTSDKLINFEGGIAKVQSRFQLLQSASPKAVPIARITSASRQVSLAARLPQIPVQPTDAEILTHFVEALLVLRV